MIWSGDLVDWRLGGEDFLCIFFWPQRYGVLKDE